MAKLEDTDWTILMKLCNNCRVSYEQLAREVGLSPNAVKNRVGNLISSGIVHKFHTILDQGVVGASHYQAIVITDGKEDIDGFVD
ncbi:MAG: Lrp/AsnC family transcriptional regulator, partial [Candidatus Thorarchaeota archaeon]